MAEPRPTPAWWPRVLDLAARAPTEEDLISHRFELISAERKTDAGLPLTPLETEQQKIAQFRLVAGPALLRAIRDVLDEPILLIKGLEVALAYPRPELRPYGDLDIVARDAVASQQALVRSGFVEVMDPSLFVDIHHVRPVLQPPFPLPVEVHKEPKWPDWLTPPSWDELRGVAVPSAVGIDGVLTLPREHHAIVMAAHSWAHRPLRNLLDLIDIAVLTDGSDDRELKQIAARWDLARVWRTTYDAVRAIREGEHSARAVRLWAGNLTHVRDRTVFENHVERFVSPFFAYRPLFAARVAASALGSEIRPAEGETWKQKFSRVSAAVDGRSLPLSEHNRRLGSRAESGRGPSRFTRRG